MIRILTNLFLILMSIGLFSMVNINLQQRQEIKVYKENSIFYKLEYDSTLNELNILRDSIIDIKKKRKEKIKESFAFYNKNIQDSTVEKFITIVEYYNLDLSNDLLNICIAQLCHESGAKHFTNKGKVIESNGWALGISQIVPTSAFQYLKHSSTDKDRSIMESLGATNLDFIKDLEYSIKTDSDTTYKFYLNSHTRNKIKNWLYHETNNLILWGYIMNLTLNNTNYDIEKSLICYNQGAGGYKDYVKQDGKNKWNHPYVLAVKSIKRKFES